MLPFSLSKSDSDIVNIERKTHSHSLIRDRITVLHLLDLGYTRKTCAHIVGCHPNSITNYIKLYLQGGLDSIKELNYSYPRHELHSMQDQVDAALSEANCSTVREVGKLLSDRFSYNRSNESVRKFLHRLGYKRRKTGTFPGKIKDFDKWQAQQDTFVANLEVLIQQAENKVIDLVFGDAAHFVYGKFHLYTWGKNPRYSPSGHGRYRINVYGAYDVVTNQVHSMYNEGYINAEFMVAYFQWLRKEGFPDRNRPLHIVLDNARYQHCDFVKQWAKDLNIELEFLPSYSPNLNLIERLWKYMKQTLAKQVHDSKNTFEHAIRDLLQSLNEQPHQDKLWTLLNPLFQRFEKSQILGC